MNTEYCGWCRAVIWLALTGVAIFTSAYLMQFVPFPDWRWLPSLIMSVLVCAVTFIGLLMWTGGAFEPEEDENPPFKVH